MIKIIIGTKRKMLSKSLLSDKNTLRIIPGNAAISTSNLKPNHLLSNTSLLANAMVKAKKNAVTGFAIAEGAKTANIIAGIINPNLELSRALFISQETL